MQGDPTRRTFLTGGLGAVVGRPLVGHCLEGVADGRIHVRLRRGLNNARVRFTRRRRGHVGFLGGSITEMDGYRPLVEKALGRRYPETAFHFTNAGIASTGSTTGVFRLDRDMLSEGPVDLLFVELAVNDDQDEQLSRSEAIRTMEGLVRHTRRHNPAADIVFVYFVNPSMLETLRDGEVPTAIAAHEAVADRYGVPAVHVAGAVADRIDDGSLTWEAYGGTHPGPEGNALAADLVGRLFDRAWEAPPAAADRKPHPLPDPLDPHHYGEGKLLPVDRAATEGAWEIRVPQWEGLDGRVRDRFRRQPLLCSSETGATLELPFTGTAVGAYVLAGPDAARVETRVDERPARTIDLYHRFSEHLHYPRTVMFADGVERRHHRLRLRSAGRKDGGGDAVRILKFVSA